MFRREKYRVFPDSRPEFPGIGKHFQEGNRGRSCHFREKVLHSAYLKKDEEEIKMLNVYAWNLCPHCHRTVEFLKKRGVPFRYLEIEEQPGDVIRKVIDVNGGEDWVVPTLEYKGQWRPGQIFDEKSLEHDLRAWGLLK